MGCIVGDCDVVLKVTVVHGWTCHESQQTTWDLFINLYKLFKECFISLSSPIWRGHMCLLVSKLPFLLSNNSLLSTECKEVANSVDLIYVTHALENFTSELLFYIFSQTVN